MSSHKFNKNKKYKIHKNFFFNIWLLGSMRGLWGQRLYLVMVASFAIRRVRGI